MASSVVCCSECEKPVEILDDDMKLSLNLHKMTHLRLDTNSQVNQSYSDLTNLKLDTKCQVNPSYSDLTHLKLDTNGQVNQSYSDLTHLKLDTNSQVNQSSSDLSWKSNLSSSSQAPFTCQICNEKVEILYNNVETSLQLHYRKHIHQPEKPSEDQMSNCSSNKSKNSNKHGVKVKKKQAVVDTIIDDVFITLPPSFRAHRGFILKNSNGVVFCNTCKTDVDIFSISDHLITKRHEESIITLLKNFIPDNLHSSLNFLIFNGSNLFCNLCNCKIDLCSSNLHETIVNILVHNAEETHASKKSSTDSEINNKSGDPQELLQSLSERSSVVNDNLNNLDVKVQFQFDCRVCRQSIAYGETENTLLSKLDSHFIGQDHAKHQNAAIALQSFEYSTAATSSSSIEDHMLIVSKGSIYCRRCFCNISNDTELIQEHVKISCPALRINKNDPFVKRVEEILIKIPSLVRTKGAIKKHYPIRNGFLPYENSLGLNMHTALNVENKDTHSRPINISKLLSLLPPKFHDIEYIVEDNDGQSVKCLVCNCRIVPSHYNIETHLTGKKHESNENLVKTANNEFNVEAVSAQNVNKSESLNLVDKVFEQLTKKDPVVKANEIILMDYGDGLNYFCSACGDLIQTSTDADRFKTNIYQHVKLDKHLNRFPNQRQLLGPNVLLKDAYTSTIDKWFSSLPKDLKGDRQFIRPHRDQSNALFCSLCKVKVPGGVNNLKTHLEGVNHCDQLDAKVINDNKKYFWRMGNDFYCDLCEAIIKNSRNDDKLNDNVMSHLEGKTHIQNVVMKLMETNPRIKDEKRYVSVKNQTVSCTKCKFSFPPGYEESDLKKHVFDHFLGPKHSSTTNSSQNQPPPPSQVSKLLKTSNSPTASNKSPITPMQLNLGSTKTSNVPRPLIDDTTSYAKDPVLEAFRKIPSHMQIDMKFIKTGSVPDFLNCSLCSKVINPSFLKDHLEEENHLKEKAIFEGRVAYWKTRV